MTTFYVDPNTIHNPATGTSPPASWGDTVRDNQQFFATPPACEANRTTNQAITTATWTAVALNAADTWDTDAFHDTATNNTRLTIPTGFGGKYAVSGFVEWESSSAGWRGTRILKNGATVINQLVSDVDSAIGHRFVFYEELALAGGDYVEMQVHQTSGGNLNVSTARFRCRWWSL